MSNSNIISDLNLVTDEAEQRLEALKEKLSELIELTAEFELPQTLNFYGCAFNFGRDSAAESHYINGDDIYNPRKEN